MRTSIDRDSVEYLRVPITAPAGTDMSTVPVKVAVVVGDTRPASVDWKDATWDDATDEAMVLLGPLATPGVRGVWVKATDSPEAPVFKVGGITVT